MHAAAASRAAQVCAKASDGCTKGSFLRCVLLTSTQVGLPVPALLAPILCPLRLKPTRHASVRPCSHNIHSTPAPYRRQVEDPVDAVVSCPFYLSYRLDRIVLRAEYLKVGQSISSWGSVFEGCIVASQRGSLPRGGAEGAAPWLAGVPAAASKVMPLLGSPCTPGLVMWRPQTAHWLVP